MKMPVLLSGHSMTPAIRLRPQSMQLSLKADGLSSASMVLGEDNPDVTIGSWVQIWAPNNEMCVMYVRNKKKDYITGKVTIMLEHTFGLLQGMIAFGDVTPETMSGTVGATTCTVYQAISYLLNRQTETLWTMAAADCDFNDAQGWKFTNSEIYSDLNSLTDSILDCQWEFDQSVFPWKLKLKAWPVSSTMEMRRSRNLKTLVATQDQSGMYTRVYPTGKNNLHIDTVNSNVSYLDRNTATYGVIAQVITDSTIKDANLLKAWATKQLRRNSEPKYTVSISGYELSESTGEPLDKLVIGRLCRIPLPEYGVTVTERLSEISWRDCIEKPDIITCTLANELKTITGVLNEQSRGGGGGSKKANTEHDVELQENQEWTEAFENTDLWINQDSIWAVCGAYEVTTWVDQGVTHKKLKMIEGTALVIERNSTEYGIFDEGNLTGGIMIDRINGWTTTKITGDVIDINGSSIQINADHIYLNGSTQISDLLTGNAQCASFWANTVKTGALNAEIGFTYQNNAVQWKTATFIKTVGSSTATLKYTDDQGNAEQNTVVINAGYTDGSINYLGR